MRQRLTLSVDDGGVLARPEVELRRLTVRPEPGLARLDALVALPSAAEGVLAYYLGFNMPLGEWEMAKCQLLASISGHAVVACEIPGLSYHGDPLPEPVRRDMMRQQVDAWAELTYRYLTAALRDLPGLPVRHVLGYSTGCSLAVAALPLLAEQGTLRALTLVEPVSITRRTLAELAVHNVADLARLPVAQGTNRGQDWVMDIRSRWLSDQAVRFSASDLLALIRVLSSDSLPGGLTRPGVQEVGLAHGGRSSLCPRPAFDLLHDRLEQADVPGKTVTVPGLGHQLWHSFPAVAGLAEIFFGTGNTLSHPDS